MPFETDQTPEEICQYMNRYLPEDICVTEVRVASDRFHSRYNAMGKTYCYTCYAGDLKPVFNRKYVYVLDQTPDVEQMKKAAEYLMGTHDFASFCSNPKMKKSTVREVDSIEIVQKGAFINFTYTELDFCSIWSDSYGNTSGGWLWKADSGVHGRSDLRKGPETGGLHGSG